MVLRMKENNMNIYTMQLNYKKIFWTLGLLLMMLINSFPSAYAHENLILEMTSYSSKLLKPDLTPNIRIFANGVIEIYRPTYMKKAGLFSGQLNQEQLSKITQLMDSLEKFDVIKAEEEYFMADLEQKRLTGQLYYSSETIITQFKIIRTENSLTSEKFILAESAREKSTRFNQLEDWKMFSDAEEMMMDLKKTLNLTRIGEAN